MHILYRVVHMFLHTCGNAATIHLFCKSLRLDRFWATMCAFKDIGGFHSVCLHVCVCVYVNNCVYSTARTMWCDDLCRLGRGSYIPCGQSAIRVAANKLFTLMVPGNWVDRLEDTQQHIMSVCDRWSTYTFLQLGTDKFVAALRATYLNF